jgi:molybdopterin-guanine dinucleotide biosynthesis protein MobB
VSGFSTRRSYEPRIKERPALLTLKIILFLGFSGGGKTTALTTLARGIARGNFGKIGTIKRIHERNFSIDESRGKDTWLHARAGASVILAFAPREMDIIRKERDTSKISTKEIIEVFKKTKVDYLLVEGLHKKFESVPKVKQIICARSEKQVLDLLDLHGGNIIFITGKFTSRFTSAMIKGVPVLSLPRDINKALELINKS